jgi:hypothetical protein
MQKIFLVLLVILPLFSVASVADLFTYDQTLIESEFAQLNQVEDKVINLDFSFDQLAAEFNLANNESTQFQSFSPNGPIGIPAFLWGCFLGPIGFIIVAVSGQSTKEIWMSALGCVVSGCVFGGIWNYYPSLFYWGW